MRDFKSVFKKNKCSNAKIKKLAKEESLPTLPGIEIATGYNHILAYGIQEWIGYIGVEKIEGSYFNVMGLPVQKLYEELKRF